MMLAHPPIWRPFVRRSAAVLALILVLAACGGSDDSSDTTAAIDTSVAEKAPAVVETTVASADGPVAAGNTVSVHYRGTLDDGILFDSSIGGAPLVFEVGAGRMILGFDDAVRGMTVGDTKTVRLAPAEAYGEYDPDLRQEGPLGDVPDGVQVGDQLISREGLVVTVLEVGRESIVVDQNHRLAGEHLTFEITLVSIDG